MVRILQSHRLRVAGALTGLAVAAGALAAATTDASAGELSSESTKAVVTATATAKQPKIALVYRGPAGCDGCSEAVANLLRSSRFHFTVRYIGPSERLRFTASSFAGASLYAQPGGDTSVAKADRLLGGSAQKLISSFVARGGRYLGFCQGAYLAGSGPGMGLLSPGNTGQYIATKGATTKSTRDTVVPVNWRGKRRTVFFQDGPYMTASHQPGERVLARYTNGRIAALVKPFGAGRVGVVGPHPEAPKSWFRLAGLGSHHCTDFDLGYDLIDVTMGR